MLNSFSLPVCYSIFLFLRLMLAINRKGIEKRGNPCVHVILCLSPQTMEKKAEKFFGIEKKSKFGNLKEYNGKFLLNFLTFPLFTFN